MRSLKLGTVQPQIFESGQAGTVTSPKAAFQEDAWQRMIQGVPSCAATANSGSSLSCLKAASADEIYAGWLGAMEGATGFLEAFLFIPVVDPGPKSVFPDSPSRLYTKGRFSRLPFIAGTNLDEGMITIFIPFGSADLKPCQEPTSQYEH